MTTIPPLELKQKYLSERREFYLEPNRIRLFVKDLDGETEAFVNYEIVTPDTRMIKRQDGRVYTVAISCGIFALVGFFLYFIGIPALMRWAPLWAVASVILFGFHFYKRRQYLVLDLSDHKSIFFLANNPSKEKLQEFLGSLFAMRNTYFREKYFVFNPVNDPESEIEKMKYLLDQEIISAAEFRLMEAKIIAQSAVDELQSSND